MIRRTKRLHVTDIVMIATGIALLALIVYGSAATLVSGRYTVAQWLDFVVSGLSQGSVYALIALGYTLVYGILRMINFAHGEVFMGGAFTTYFLAQWTSLSECDRVATAGCNPVSPLEANPLLVLTLLVLFSAAVSTALAVLLERIAYRPLRGAPRLIPLITAIGASFFLQYTFRGLYGSGIKAYPQVPALDGAWVILGVRILRTQAVVIVAALVLMLALYLFVQRTRTGQAMRAVSEDKAVAALMGIDVDRTIAITFAVGGALAGAAGVLYGLIFGQVNFFMGFLPGLKAFTAAVLGGIGNIPGAMLGGLFLGVAESVGPSLFLEGLGVPSPHQLKDAIAFGMLVLVLIFRPTGLLGERIGRRA